MNTHWIALFSKRSEIVYFDSFGVEYIPEEIKEFIRNKNIKANIFQVQENNSIMCGYFCIGFIDFMLAGEKLTDFTAHPATRRCSDVVKTSLCTSQRSRRYVSVERH